MPLLENVTFVCLDCETTGLDADKDQIIEVGAIRFTMTEILGEYESLVNPKCEIPESSIAIHHITPEMVADKPTIKEVLPSLLEFIGNDIIIGHGIGFDVEIVAKAADRFGISTNIRKNKQIDTLRLARHYGESPVNSLEQLRRHFNIQAEGAHRAMNDVIVNMGVFRYLAKRYKTLQDLYDLLARPALLKIMPLGKYKGRAMKEIPIDYLLRSAKRDFDMDLLYSIRSEIKRRKKGNLFTQAANPFAEL